MPNLDMQLIIHCMSCGCISETRLTCIQVRGKVEAAAVPLAKYIIRKQLTKRPEDYPDAATQPHVQVYAGPCGPTKTPTAPSLYLPLLTILMPFQYMMAFMLAFMSAAYIMYQQQGVVCR